jgi:type VI secretion system VasD/TssJ family lipoprotein
MSRKTASDWRICAPPNVVTILAAAGVSLVLLTCFAGCGWIFGKRDKPMNVVVELTGSNDLNFDGSTSHPVRVKVYLITSGSNFGNADKDVFFDPTRRDELAGVLAKDVLDSGSVIVLPSETASLELLGRHDKVLKSKPVLCAIADFYRSAGPTKERIILNIPKKTDQKVKLQIGRDSISKGRK